VAGSVAAREVAGVLEKLRIKAITKVGAWLCAWVCGWWWGRGCVVGSMAQRAACLSVTCVPACPVWHTSRGALVLPRMRHAPPPPLPAPHALQIRCATSCWPSWAACASPRPTSPSSSRTCCSSTSTARASSRHTRQTCTPRCVVVGRLLVSAAVPAAAWLH
jgi:hypothetical protein